MGWSPVDIITLVTALLPLILEIIKLIESLFGGSSGAVKKAAAMSIMDPLIPPGAKAVVSRMIDAQVAKFKADGTFNHPVDTGP